MTRAARRNRPGRVQLVVEDERVLGPLPGDTGAAPRPVVQIVPGNRSAAIDEAEQYLIDRDDGLFQRNDTVVRVGAVEIDIGGGEKASGLRVIAVGREHMRERFTRAVDLHRFDKRSDSWVSIDCPKDFAEAYLERAASWRLPILRAVTTIPTLRRDGTIIERPGYDAGSGVFFDPRGVSFPPVPGAPAKDAALAALERHDELLGTFDFVDETSRSVAESGMLTAVFRNAMSAAPIHGISATVAGSGKSKIVNLAALLVLGHPAPVTSLGQREEETEKRIATTLVHGDTIVSIDNVERAIGGELLCQVVTEPLINIRILGSLGRFIGPNVATWFATGNNFAFAGDMVRRALMCRLDPGCERPELREFETPDPCVIAREKRPELVVDALTIARAFWLAGCPQSEPPIGSFEDWSRWVRDPLIWLGRADPATAMERVRHDDPVLIELGAVIAQWRQVIGDERVTGRELITTAAQEIVGSLAHPEFHDALLTVAGDRGVINGHRLGKWLGRVKGRVIGGWRIEAAEMLRGMARWQLRTADRTRSGSLN
jgi:hypothetical protein